MTVLSKLSWQVMTKFDCMICNYNNYMTCGLPRIGEFTETESRTSAAAACGWGMCSYCAMRVSIWHAEQVHELYNNDTFTPFKCCYATEEYP